MAIPTRAKFQRLTRKPGTQGRAVVAREGAVPQRRLLGTISLGRLRQSDDPTRTDAVGRLVPATPTAWAMLAIGHEVATSEAVAINEAAGQAAFETYGTSGARINPHRPGSHEQADWNKGFVHSAEGRWRRSDPNWS
jgi:hypothetical protein